MKAVVLLSGGLDSAVCLALAQRRELRDCTALYVDYMQANEFSEFNAARTIAAKAVVDLVSAKARSAFDSGLHNTRPLDYGRTVMDIGAANDAPSSYVPARNLLLLSFALSLAESIGAGEIWIGANSGDREGYPDCRREFFDAFERVASKGTRQGSVSIRAPLLDMNKRDIVELARFVGVRIDDTVSCYLGTSCGECDACVLRADALAAP